MKVREYTGSRDEMFRVLESQIEAERDGIVARLGHRFSLEESEDIFQEACLRAIERLEQSEATVGLRPWFQSVLRSTLVTHLREHEADRDPQPTLDVMQVPLIAEEARTCSCGLTSLEQIRPGYRKVLRAIVLESRSTAEVARLENTTPNNIRVRLHRARAALRKVWEGACGSRRATCPRSDCLCGNALEE